MNECKLYTAHLAGTSYDGNKKYEMVIIKNGKIQQRIHQKKDTRYIISHLITSI